VKRQNQSGNAAERFVQRQGKLRVDAAPKAEVEKLIQPITAP
jgi:hypothetical protein